MNTLLPYFEVVVDHPVRAAGSSALTGFLSRNPSGQIVPSPSFPAYLVLNPHQLPSPIEYSLFGIKIPYLPDFLSDPSIAGRDDVERVNHILHRWTQLVADLWKWHTASFSLRFLSDPDRGKVEIVLLCRVAAQVGQSGNVSQALVHDLTQLAASINLPTEPLPDATSLAKYRSPFPRPQLIEIRQHEEIVRLTLGDAYVVHPYWSAANDWLSPFEVLLRQRMPALINIHLEPTRLQSVESDGFAQAASVAQTLSNFQYSGYYFQGQISDPQAGVVGRVYAATHKRLTQPFLLNVQIASPDEITAISVARTLGTSITAQSPRSNDEAERDLPSGFDMLVPRNDLEVRAVQHTLTNLELVDWGDTQASQGKERLRYLADARGASAAFRLPIGLRSGVPGIVTKQIAPAYNIGERRPEAASDEIELGTLHGGGVATIKLRDLTQHGLIVGFTGTGKTNTCLQLLDQLWRQKHLPFLVIEPAKTEYRGLIDQPGFEDLLVFTLGDETVSPFRLNPFELLPGVRLEAHIGALRACFDAALPQFGVLPMLIEESVHAIYADKGWQLTDKGGDSRGKLFPTLRDMHRALGKTIEKYAGELKQNLLAASSKRIGSLLVGSKGHMFNTQRSIPMSLLMQRPVVLELDSLNDDEKALAMMFVLMMLREYSKTRRGRGLQHVTLIEEAHRVMSNTAPTGNTETKANTQAEGAQAFAGMLAEIRAYGEGILIAEQSPTKLVRDAIANTNLKIAHKLQDQHEREAMATAMTMDDEQQTYLGRLQRGQAAIFTGDQEKATFMSVRSYKDAVDFDDRLPDDDVRDRMQPFRQENMSSFVPFDGCRFCTSQCQYRDATAKLSSNIGLRAQLRQALLTFEQKPQPNHWRDNWSSVAEVAASAATQSGRRGKIDAAWCYLAHEIDFSFTAHMRQQFESAFKTVTKG